MLGNLIKISLANYIAREKNHHTYCSMGSLMFLEEYTKLDVTDRQKWMIKCEIVVILVYKENLSLWFHFWQSKNQLDKGKSPNRTKSKLELRYYEERSKHAYIFPGCLYMKFISIYCFVTVLSE